MSNTKYTNNFSNLSGGNVVELDKNNLVNYCYNDKGINSTEKNILQSSKKDTFKKSKNLKSKSKKAKSSETNNPKSSIPKYDKSSVIMVNSDTRTINCVEDQYRLLFNIGHSDGNSLKIDEMNNSIKVLESGIYRIDLSGYIVSPVTLTGLITMSIDSDEITPLTTFYVKTYSTHLILSGIFTICPLRKGDDIKLLFIPDGHEYLQKQKLVLTKGSRIAVTRISDNII